MCRGIGSTLLCTGAVDDASKRLLIPKGVQFRDELDEVLTDANSAAYTIFKNIPSLGPEAEVSDGYGPSGIAGDGSDSGSAASRRVKPDSETGPGRTPNRLAFAMPVSSASGSGSDSELLAYIALKRVHDN